MKAPFFTAACAAVAVFVSISSPSIAQEKTVKQCQDEWRANKADNQAKGIKEKDYVAQCRGAAAAARAGCCSRTGARRPSASRGGKGQDSEGMSNRMAGEQGR